jgi:ABC-type transporter Mla subunit MlaD
VSGPRWWRRRSQLPVPELQRSNPVRLGLVLIAVVTIAVYFGFTKHIPFKHGYRLNAEFASALNIHSKAPVRIAGVDVGTVTSIKRDGNTGLVTMEIASNGLPIHSDATAKIRPRIFLEGNWFVELQPGSPSAGILRSGATLPVTQTADPVQLDQVLAALNTDTRANLQNFLIGYGDALTRKPNAAENAEQDPEVRGLNAAQALNKAYQNGPASLRGNAIVNQAITGTEENDLSKLVASIGKVTGALNVHEQALGELIGNFNTFFAAFANQSPSLRALAAQLHGSLLGIERGFAALDSSLPSTRTFARDILPGVRLTPATVAATLPWIEQVEGSLGPNELGGVAKSLQAAVPSLARLTSEQIPFQEQTNALSKCQTNVIFPSGNARLQDATGTSGVENYKEFWYSLVGLGGIGQSFNGNGANDRFMIGSGGQPLKSAPVQITGAETPPGLHLLAQAQLPPLGTRPAFPAQEPPYMPKVPCYTQPVPNFNGPLASGPADGSG